MLRHLCSLPLCAIAVSVLAGSTAEAQQKNDGFAQATGITISVAEMAGATQKQPDGTPPNELFLPGYPNLWVMELQYKPIRMIRMPVRDPKTGQTNRELIWYMVWRGVRRDYTQFFQDTTKDELIAKLRNPDVLPQNPEDPAEPQLVSPHFTLVTTDEGDQKVYHDVLLPEVQRAIAQREGLNVRNSAQAIQEVPPLAENPADQVVIEGVALWRNVDPKTDYLSVFMSGLSNAYRVGKGPEGKMMVERKTVVQKFWRPGDEFEQDEREFRVQGKPEWIYRAEPWALKWPASVQTQINDVMIMRQDTPPNEVLKNATGG